MDLCDSLLCFRLESEIVGNEKRWWVPKIFDACPESFSFLGQGDNVVQSLGSYPLFLRAFIRKASFNSDRHFYKVQRNRRECISVCLQFNIAYCACFGMIYSTTTYRVSSEMQSSVRIYDFRRSHLEICLSDDDGSCPMFCCIRSLLFSTDVYQSFVRQDRARMTIYRHIFHSRHLPIIKFPFLKTVNVEKQPLKCLYFLWNLQSDCII